MNNLGEARRAYQETLDSGRFTQEDLAGYLGIGVGAVKNWEQGKTQSIKSRYLSMMADLYGVTTDYLLGRTDDPGARAARLGGEAELLGCYRRLDAGDRAVLVRVARAIAAGGPGA